MNSNSSTKENVYLALINECHDVINVISEKTRIMQSEVDSIKEENARLSNSTLERELQQLLSHLIELNGNLFV